MKSPKFLMLVALPGTGKTTYAKKFLEENPDWVYISLDDIHFQRTGAYGLNNNEDKMIATQMIKQASLKKKNIIFDSTNNKLTKRRGFLSILNGKGYYTEILYWNTRKEVALNNLQKRANETGHVVPKFALEEHFTFSDFPLHTEVDSIKVFTEEKINQEASAIFKGSIDLLKKDVYEWSKKYDEFIHAFLPELANTINFGQYNRHSLDLYSHLLKTTYNISKLTDNDLLIVSALFHDIGKYYTRRFLTKYDNKSYVVTNANDCLIHKTTEEVRIYPYQGRRSEMITVNINELPHIHGTFFGHDSVGSRFAYDICTRLGFNEQECLYIANIIQLHMEMPSEQQTYENKGRWDKFKDKCNGYIEDLTIFRKADAGAR
jgi:predicted kinase